MLPFMHARPLLLAVVLLVGTTGCGSHAVEKQASAAMAAEATCLSRFDRQFHLQGGSKAGSEGFVRDLGDGRLRVTGSVPERSGLAHPESYTCVVVPGSSGMRIVSFEVRRVS
jgi:hypothetical protein